MDSAIIMPANWTRAGLKGDDDGNDQATKGTTAMHLSARLDKLERNDGDGCVIVIWQNHDESAALKAAKARGVKLGSPVARETVAIATAHRRGDTSANRVSALKAIQKIQAADIVSARGIARELTARKVPTPTGSSTWAPAQVQRLLRTDRPSGRRS